MVSSVLLWEDEGVQKLVYYTKLLKDIDPLLEDGGCLCYLNLGLVASTIFPGTLHYCSSGPTLRSVLQNLDTFERITKRAVELKEFDIHYRPWPSIKVQVLTNFLMECTLLEGFPKKLKQKQKQQPLSWQVTSGCFTSTRHQMQEALEQKGSLLAQMVPLLSKHSVLALKPLITRWSMKLF